MGTDITTYAEYDKHGEGKWRTIVEPRFTNPYYRKPESFTYYNLPLTLHPYVERDYRVFALLANVRNSFGITPLAEPKGLPKDFKNNDEYEEYGYSHSWFTLAELEQHDWTKETEIHGGQFTKLTLPELKQFVIDHGSLTTENLRIVFWFDS